MAKDTAPGKWVSSCSGHVDSVRIMTKRRGEELIEEIGLRDPVELKRLFKAPCEPTGNEFVWGLFLPIGRAIHIGSTQRD